MSNQNVKQLIRLTLARKDFESAKAICQWLQERDVRTGSEFHDTLWTAMTVIYWRPFTENKGIGGLDRVQYGRFDAERLQALHDHLEVARNTRFAHTQRDPTLAIQVFPRGGWAASGDGNTSVSKIPYGRDELPELEDLFDVQIERTATRIVALVDVLYGEDEWEPGTILDLEWPTPQGESTPETGRREKVVQDLPPDGIVNALRGHTIRDVGVQDDLASHRVTKLWITFSDPAVLELEAVVEAGEPALLARMHYRRDESTQL